MSSPVADDVTVVIPTIPPRRHDLLPEALYSVYQQDHPIDAISIAVDTHKQGAWQTRQRALDAALTTWVAFLDDDDLFKPMHVRRLLEHAADTNADYVFSYWDLEQLGDFLGLFGKPFDAAKPHHTTMTVLVKTELAKNVGFSARNDSDIAGGEDWRFMLGCVSAGANIVHLPEQTWVYRWHGSNTSGREDVW
jgi:glycosyltransferase involved in cell wall biosynthesis